MTIGSNIRWIRLLTGMTQEEFAELVGATKATLYTYESGRTVPNELILSKIAAIAGITISELESTDLKTKTINVVNPETKEMEFQLTTGQETKDVKELEKKLSELQKLASRLEAENNLLKELVSKQLEKS